ncbi:MAG: translation initiation factor IF-2 [Bacteroidales bacterium]|jgi:translation initiation factor IF-2|nr:translation initiation factor IF-2 [Bacteroidales bacterium]
MSEGKSNKSIRLKQVATEFNIGITTIIEYLNKKGKEVENNPNARIDAEAYELLSNAFQSERQKKDKANSLQLNISKKIEKEIVAEDSHQEQATTTPSSNTEPIQNEVIIKTSTIDFKKTSDQKDKKDIIKEKKSKPIETPSDSIKERPIEKKPLTPVINENDKQEIETKDGKQKVNILGTIDLSSINSKTKPDKKSPQEKEKIKEMEKKSNKDKKKNKDNKDKNKQKNTLSEEKKQKNNKEQQKHDSKKDKKEFKKEPNIAKTPTTTEIKKEEPKKEEPKEFIKTSYVKLSGPTLTGEKVDLSQFQNNTPKKKKGNAPNNNGNNKPKQDGADKERKKRKRIKTNGVTPINKSNTFSQDSKDKFAKKNNTPNDFKKKGSKKKDTKKKVEIDSVEIEKQIKETLARLSPMGKSKTSKHRREKRQNINQHLQEELLQEEQEKKVLKVTEFVTANELATMMNVPVTNIIASCMQLGMFVSINQRLDAEAIQLIADEFGYKIEFVSAEVVNTLDSEEEEDNEGDLVPRSPIVTVMGHVDHGKTSLLDYIRKTNVIAGEAGGITQHIGAYEVRLPHSGKKITFLDTPGHEAFTAMRARGAKMTDIAIIVVACDDKIMPQTIEAINHAQAAGVPIVFALNKIDKPGADPERIKGELANMNLLVEDWGGKIQSQEISAKKGTNIEQLLEKVLLEAEMLDLKGNPNKRAKGVVIESSLDKGRGYVAKILVQDGTIKQSDFVLAGTTFGRVKAMYNERNQIIETAGPSTPLLLLGLNGAPQAGDTFNVVVSEKEAKDLANKRQQLQREQGLRTQKHITLDEIGRRIAIGDFKQLDLIIKADVDGSVEALSDSLLKLSTPEVQVNVIHKSVGQITESDVLLATASNAIIIGFQVRPSLGARKLAEQEQIDIRLYSIIYDAINELKDAIEGMLSPEIKEKVVANLDVKEVFKISKVGTIAGCMCIDGKINKQTKIRLIRDGIVVYTGVLASLKRFKDDVKEVVSGQDCGLNIENFNDIKVGDIIEGYDEIEVKRKL